MVVVGDVQLVTAALAKALGASVRIESISTVEDDYLGRRYVGWAGTPYAAPTRHAPFDVRCAKGAVTKVMVSPSGVLTGIGGSFGLLGNKMTAGINETGAPGGVSTSGAFGGYEYMTHSLQFDVGPTAQTDLQFAWPNWTLAPQETMTATDIRVSAVLVLGDGTTYQLTWNGATSIVIAPGQTVWNDLCAAVLLPDTRYRVIINVSVVTSGQGYPITAFLEPNTLFPLEGFIAAGTAISDAANVAVTPASASAVVNGFAALPVYAPIAMRGTTAENSVRLVLAGDSILYGVGDTDLTTAYRGYAMRAIGTDLPVLRLTAPGDEVTMFNTGTLRDALRTRCGATHCIYEFGTNDLAAGVTFPQLQAQARLAWQRLAARGVKIFACTLTPRTSSTDGWLTLDNQTLTSFEAARLAYNAWLRAGADGQLGGVFDPDKLVADPAGSGKWAVSAGALTADGTHPNTPGHIKASAAIDVSLLSI